MAWHENCVFLRKLTVIPSILKKFVKKCKLTLNFWGFISIINALDIFRERYAKFYVSSVEAGRFRRDLYERLKSLHIQLPALRERREDILALAKHFLAKENNASSRKVADINPEVLSLFDVYSWPGNIRELEGIIGRAVLLAEEGEILPDHLPEDVRMPQVHTLPSANETVAANPNAPEYFVPPFPMETTLKEIEKSAILTTLARENGNRSKTAAVLGISRVTLNAKLRTYSDEA